MKNTKFPLILLTITTVIFSTANLVITVPSQAEQNQTQANETKKPKSTWETILALFREQKRPKLGSRGVCLVSPGILETTDKIWHNQPSFVWQSNSSALEVRLYSIDNHNQPLWRKEIGQKQSESTFQEIVYTGEALQQGKRYDWEIFDSTDKNKYRQSFTIMAIEEYNAIAEDLNDIETKLAKERMSAEQIILAKANYFAQKGLLSDALTQMSSIENPSPEFRQKKASLLADLCITKK